MCVTLKALNSVFEMVIQSLKLTGISHTRDRSKDDLKYEDIDRCQVPISATITIMMMGDVALINSELHARNFESVPVVAFFSCLF